MQTNFTPVATEKRIAMLDVLRGFAIFGILMVNMQLFHQPFIQMMEGYTGSASVADFLSLLVIKVFFEGKFYVMFSMLFGYGFYLFMSKQTEDGSSIVPVFRRRVFFLLLFGILHVLLLWTGDILIFYALFGFVLLLFRKVSDRGLIKWAIPLTIIPVLITGLFALLFMFARSLPDFNASVEADAARWQQILAEVNTAYTSGSFSEVASTRVREWLLMLPGVLFFYPVVLAMFLLGVWAARKGILKNTEENLAFFRKVLVWGLALGIPFVVLYFISYLNVSGREMNAYMVLQMAGHAYGGIFLGLAYVSAIVLLISNGRLKTFGRLLSPVGRMALTNYLLHSIICSAIFLPYGLGLFGKITHWQGILLTIVIYALQIPFSRWWLSKFKYGPFEWLWRSLTYLRWQPMLRAQSEREGLRD